MWDKNSDLDDYLAHYGVLGMKWGVRNANYSTVRKKGAVKLEKIDTKSAQSSKIKAKAAKFNYKSAKLDYKNLKRRAKGQPEIISKKQQKAAKLNMKAATIDNQIFKMDRKVTKLVDIASKKEVDMQAADRWEALFDRRVRDVG